MDIPPLGMRPTRQRFETRDTARAQFDQGLKVEPHIAVFNGLLQLRFHIQPVSGMGYIAGFIDLGPAGFLRVLQRDLRMADHLIRRCEAFVPKRAADRAIDAKLDLRQSQRRCDRGLQAARDMERIARSVI